MKNSNTDYFELFVPGRVCLFGEHSDWAGGHRRTNSALATGAVIISGTNQGMYARCRKRDSELIVRSTLPDGTVAKPWRVPMDVERLQQEAAAGGFYSYAAGVAAHMLDFYGVGGLEIENYKTTLPVKKGLSSSAAFCVLVARAFNQAYGLALTTRAEIEAAYQGEIATPSRCGRMDQGCAYGQIPVMMTFDGDRMTSTPLRPGGNFYLLIADLCGKKDTVRILSDLNASFPFAKSAKDETVQRCLGVENQKIVAAAREAIERGDAPALGALMNEAQNVFDTCLMPVCDELLSPRLHTVLGDRRTGEWAYGGKGVGSQGDGSVQFICKSKDARAELAAYLQQQYSMSCFDLDIEQPASVRKAVIPVAGLGTRMYPYTKAVPKTFLPIVTPDGVIKPVIQTVIEEALSAGVEEVALIIQPGDEALFENYFMEPTTPEILSKLPPALRDETERLANIGKRLTLIPQDEAKGFGHAVLQAERWVGNEPFLLLLGDHLFRSKEIRSVARQVTDLFQMYGESQSVVGIYEESLERVVHYGAVAGEWIDDRTLQLDRIIEKPSEDDAQLYLKVERRGHKTYFCVNGIYALRPSIFSILQQQAAENRGGEVQLTTALETQREEEGIKGLVVKGVHYDTGRPSVYADTVGKFAGA
jgi:UTP-glucose-1-phosphate uridylyltransferase/mevalonate kinase